MPKETALPLRVTKGLKAKLENFEFNELKPFACFAFPPPMELQNRQSVTWSIRGREQQLHFSRESNEEGIPASVVEPGQVYAFRNVIINPVAVPPFLRVNLDTIELHAEVDMVASGHPGLAARAHDLASFHHVAFVHINLAKVAVDRL